MDVRGVIKIKNIGKLFGLIALFLGLTMQSSFAAKPKIPKNKAGATWHNQSTGNYTLSLQSNTSTKGAATASLIGFAFFYERLMLDRFSAGFKYGYGLERSLEMEVGTSTVEVLETASFWEIEFRAFMRDNMRPGLKPYIGVGYGNITTTSTLAVLSSGSKTDDETSATIPFTELSAGFDYTFGFGGIRLQASMITGKRNDLESSSTYYATYDYNGGALGISVYSFF